MKRLLMSMSLFAVLMMTPISARSNLVYLGGETVAVTVNYVGVLISGMYEFEIAGETILASKEATVQIGDRIVEVNGNQVKSMEDLFKQLSQFHAAKELVPVKVVRSGQQMDATLLLCYLEDEKVFKTGLYVKDTIKGIGTLTFIDPVNGVFAALGHEIIENDLQQPADVSLGDIFEASVISIRKSSIGSPGEKLTKNGVISLGTIRKNSIYGVYGNMNRMPQNRTKIPVGVQAEVQLGEAQILTVIDGNQPEYFTIQIVQLTPQENQDVKGILFEVTDPRLLNATGGIVQGMSGSPIIQNGKLIGAVTHMITSKPTKGYGIYIEWMQMEADQLN